MKVLLIGEYSRLHNSLKEGLVALGHEVTLVGSGDAFKKYPVDINIKSKYVEKYCPLILRKLFFKILNFDILDFEVSYRINKIIPKLKGYDVVQLINENALSIHPKLQMGYLKKIIAQNETLFLLCCGEDYVSISHALKNENRYSILSPLLRDKKLIKQFQYSLKYVSKPYEILHKFLKKHINGVIATDLDYHIPYLKEPNYLGLIPNPINHKTLDYKPIKDLSTIKIFHGVNSNSAVKKGSDFFNEALKIIKKKYTDTVEIITTYDIPYKAYIARYDNCHILLDQVYGYDQGYNALEAMAKGKVVFTGAEKEWLEYYNLKEDTVAINALPDAEKIAEKLEWLILNPEKIIEISKNARAFIEREHDYIRIANMYISKWTH